MESCSGAGEAAVSSTCFRSQSIASVGAVGQLHHRAAPARGTQAPLLTPPEHQSGGHKTSAAGMLPRPPAASEGTATDHSAARRVKPPRHRGQSGCISRPVHLPAPLQSGRIPSPSHRKVAFFPYLRHRSFAVPQQSRAHPDGFLAARPPSAGHPLTVQLQDAGGDAFDVEKVIE